MIFTSFFKQASVVDKLFSSNTDEGDKTRWQYSFFKSDVYTRIFFNNLLISDSKT